MTKKDAKPATLCVGCGDPVKEAKEMYQEFQTEAAAELYCPDCRQQKHFGVIHSE